jgi:uncharacterized protein YbbC (DUF1343 family)
MAAPCELTVVQMHGWHRNMAWEDTGLRWVPTSPNIPRATSPLYYVATGLVGELSGPELGIGGPAPFQSIAASWLDAASFTRYLRSLDTPGVNFAEYRSGRYQGSSLRIDPETGTNLTGLGIYMMAEMSRFARPDMFRRSSASKLDIFYKVYGSQSIRAQIENRKSPASIVASWKANEQEFRRERAPFLLY